MALGFGLFGALIVGLILYGFVSMIFDWIAKMLFELVLLIPWKPSEKPLPSEPPLVLPEDQSEFDEITQEWNARTNHYYDDLDEYYTEKLDAIFRRAKHRAAQPLS